MMDTIYTQLRSLQYNYSSYNEWVVQLCYTIIIVYFSSFRHVFLWDTLLPTKSSVVKGTVYHHPPSPTSPCQLFISFSLLCILSLS